MIYQLESEITERSSDRPLPNVPSSSVAQNTRNSHRTLGKGELLTIDLGPEQSLHVYVETGEIWLTAEGDKNDYVLGSGEQMLISREGRVVLEGLHPAMIRFE